MNYNKKRECDHCFKIIIIGDSFTGKSCLVERYIQNKFDSDNVTTIGIEFYQRFVEHDGKIIKLQFWDTAGQEAYHSICKSYYRDAAGIIICFSRHDRNSFMHVNKWLNEVKTECKNPNRVLLVGTKSDYNKFGGGVTSDEIYTFAKKNNLEYIETSAKHNIGVEDCFKKITEIIYNDYDKNILVDKIDSIIPLDTITDDEPNKSHCYIC